MSAQAPSIPGYGEGRLLGRGGYAVVYLYRDESRGEEVAVKILTLLDASARSQFADEIRVLSSFGDDPLIVPYLGEGAVADTQPYFVMRYCPGGSLSRWVGTGGLSVAQVVEAGLRIGRALEAVHRRNWLHRDIKPSNILVDEEGRAPRLSDFGIATPSRNGAAAGPGDPAISVAWSAPEVVAKASRGDVASEVYSLGATLWHLLTGHAPYEIPGGDNSPEALERRVLGSRLPGLGRDGVPTALEHLLRSMLEKDPAARPRSAADVVSVLELIEARSQAAIVSARSEAAADAGEPPGRASAPVGSPLDAPAPARSSKRRMLIIAAAALPAVGGLVAAGSLSHHGASGAAQASRSTGPAAVGGSGAQDAGVLGDAVPPGTPDVSVTRLSPTSIRFTWTYSAPEATDGFAWRVVGGARSGASNTTSIDLTDPAGQRLCIQVRVLRAGSGEPGSSWSAAECGS